MLPNAHPKCTICYEPLGDDKLVKIVADEEFACGSTMFSSHAAALRRRQLQDLPRARAPLALAPVNSSPSRWPTRCCEPVPPSAADAHRAQPDGPRGDRHCASTPRSPRTSARSSEPSVGQLVVGSDPNAALAGAGLSEEDAAPAEDERVDYAGNDEPPRKRQRPDGASSSSAAVVGRRRWSRATAEEAGARAEAPTGQAAASSAAASSAAAAEVSRRTTTASVRRRRASSMLSLIAGGGAILAAFTVVYSDMPTSVMEVAAATPRSSSPPPTARSASPATASGRSSLTS